MGPYKLPGIHDTRTSLTHLWKHLDYMQHFCFRSTFLTCILRYFDIIKLVCDVSPNFLFYCVRAIFAASSTPVSPLNRSMNRTKWFVLHFPSDNYFSLFLFIIYDRQTSLLNVARAVYFFGSSDIDAFVSESTVFVYTTLRILFFYHKIQ